MHRAVGLHEHDPRLLSALPDGAPCSWRGDCASAACFTATGSTTEVCQPRICDGV